eukprot:5969233-Pleurochrysis_carterae.AAC.6
MPTSVSVSGGAVCDGCGDPSMRPLSPHAPQLRQQKASSPRRAQTTPLSPCKHSLGAASPSARATVFAKEMQRELQQGFATMREAERRLQLRHSARG